MLGNSTKHLEISLETQQDDIHCLSEVFQTTDVEVALAAGIFHRKEVPIADVKSEGVKSPFDSCCSIWQVDFHEQTITHIISQCLVSRDNSWSS